MSYVMNTYARQPIGFVKGEGAWLIDDKGKRYLDAVSGVAVTSVGHAHPKVVEAICEQAKSLLHTSNQYQICALALNILAAEDGFGTVDLNVFRRVLTRWNLAIDDLYHQLLRSTEPTPERGAPLRLAA